MLPNEPYIMYQQAIILVHVYVLFIENCFKITNNQAALQRDIEAMIMLAKILKVDENHPPARDALDILRCKQFMSGDNNFLESGLDNIADLPSEFYGEAAVLKERLEAIRVCRCEFLLAM